jgi:hypothetical protein
LEVTAPELRARRNSGQDGTARICRWPSQIERQNNTFISQPRFLFCLGRHAILQSSDWRPVLRILVLTAAWPRKRPTTVLCHTYTRPSMGGQCLLVRHKGNASDMLVMTIYVASVCGRGTLAVRKLSTHSFIFISRLLGGGISYHNALVSDFSVVYPSQIHRIVWTCLMT